MSSFQEIEVFQNQNIDFNEEERELEEALSLSDLPITTIGAKNEENEAKLEEGNLDYDFDFGSLVGSMGALDGEMCAADDVFSGGQILPYRNSVSSMSGLRSYSRSESIDRRGFESRSSSSRSSSIRSHYSSTSNSSGSSNNTIISAKTVPLVSKIKVQNQFHSHPSPKPQILGSSVPISTHTSPIGKKSKMWEVLKLGLVRTPEIELQDLKLRHRTNNFSKSIFPRNNNNSSNSNNNNNNNNDQARRSCSNDGNIISDFVLEMQKKKIQSQQQISENNIGNKNGGFFKSCKCSIEAINPMPSRPNYYYGDKSCYFGTSKYGSSQNNQAREQVSKEDKILDQKKKHQQEQEQRKTNKNRQEKQEVVMVMSHQQQNRTFEWLKNLSHASVLNS